MNGESVRLAKSSSLRQVLVNAWQAASASLPLNALHPVCPECQPSLSCSMVPQLAWCRRLVTISASSSDSMRASSSAAPSSSLLSPSAAAAPHATPRRSALPNLRLARSRSQRQHGQSDCHISVQALFVLINRRCAPGERVPAGAQTALPARWRTRPGSPPPS